MPSTNTYSKTNLRAAAAALDEYWSPRVVGRVNDQYIKVAKLEGEFPRHQHDDEDEMFMVLEGSLCLRFDDGDVVLDKGEFYVVPKGTPHTPIAARECLVALIETVTTKHTGDVESPLTKTIDEQLG